MDAPFFIVLFKSLFFRGLGLLVVPLAVHAGSAYQHIESRSVSPAMAIGPLLKDQATSTRSGRYAFTRNHFEMGVWQNNWQIAYTQSNDYILHFSQATADIYQQDKAKQTLNSGGDKRLYFEAWQLRSQGLKLGYQFNLPQGFYLVPSISWLQGMDFQQGTLDGIGGVADKDMSGSLDLHYRYSKDKLLEDTASPDAAYGYALALLVGWENTVQAVWFKADNIAGQVKWYGAPITTGVFDTDRQAPGSMTANALFIGKRYRADFIQRLPFQLTAHYHYDYKSWQYFVDADYYIKRMWLSPGISYIGWAWAPFIAYEISGKEWQLGVKHRYLSFLLGSDRIPLKNAHAFSLQLKLQQYW